MKKGFIHTPSSNLLFVYMRKNLSKFMYSSEKKEYKNLVCGFTLVELLMVIGIIGILASVVMVGLGGARQKSRDAIRIDDLKTLSLAAETYFLEHNYEWPSGISDLGEYFSEGVAPTDPLGGDYLYQKVDDGTAHKYCFGAKLETQSLQNSVDCDPVSTEDNYGVMGPPL